MLTDSGKYEIIVTIPEGKFSKEVAIMKIELQYKEPGTQIKGYIFNAVYDEEDYKEACDERQAAEKLGYEITIFRLVHDEDVTLA